MDPNQQPQTQTSTAPQPMPGTASTAEDPGKTLAIISLVMAFVGLQIVGLVLGIISKSKSKKAGYPTTLATVGIIVNSVIMVIGFIILTALVITSYNGVRERAQQQLKDSSYSQQQ